MNPHSRLLCHSLLGLVLAVSAGCSFLDLESAGEFAHEIDEIRHLRDVGDTDCGDSDLDSIARILSGLADLGRVIASFGGSSGDSD